MKKRIYLRLSAVAKGLITASLCILLVSNVSAQAVPVAAVSIDSGASNLCLPTPSVTFNNNSTISDGSTMQFTWIFGDGTPNDPLPPGAPVSVQHSYPGTGLYTVQLVAISGADITDTATIVLNIYSLPIAGYQVTQQALCAQNLITFLDESSAAAGIKSYNWDFGDGSAPLSLSIPGTTYTYNTPNTYTVRLTVVDNNGCNSTASNPITVSPLPQPDFTFSPVCIPDSVILTPSNSGNAVITNWQWEFDDGGTSTGQNPTPAHYFTTGGSHTVELVEYSSAGCIDSVQHTIPVNNPPIANFSIDSINNLCSSGAVTLVDNSTSNGTYGPLTEIQIVWDSLNNPQVIITDNSPAAGGTYGHKYPTIAADTKYLVSLRAYSNSGCFAYVSDTIVALASPSAQLPPFRPNTVCQNSPTFVLQGGFELNNLPGTGFYSGIGVTPDSTEFSPQLATPGTHPIQYTFITNNGCSSDTTQDITVKQSPTIDYGSVQTVLTGDSITLSPSTLPPAGTTYAWTPGTYLSSDTVATPLVTPSTNQTYTIIATLNGCPDSTTLLVRLISDFKVPNTFTPNGDGINDYWVIEQLSYYPNHRVRVFDRYGQTVYETTQFPAAPIGWNGYYKGKPLAAGTYYYIIELAGVVDPKTGYVTILR
jgi:gliding motility-associated-like protein